MKFSYSIIFLLFFGFSASLRAAGPLIEETKSKKCELLRLKANTLEDKLQDLDWMPVENGGGFAILSLGAPYFTYRAIKYGPKRAFKSRDILSDLILPMNWPFYPLTLPVAILGGAGIWTLGSVYKKIRTPILEAELTNIKGELENLGC